ncbi:MAG TPA: isoprenylcysteine carboxylmethyltransferase family protein [Candidatus Polarisedimenticolaceae bacterium]|nr:isoprenylcysteine carboxylmethyltransferase family protein [Candidatus Polarisedimenticolaceae bacterium]
MAVWISASTRVGAFAPGVVSNAVAVGLLAGGLILRWWAILVLGRWFTVDVAIQEGHELVTRGPYRWLRHPSYTGAFVAFVGMSLTFANSLAAVAFVAPILAALIARIHVEERALAAQFGTAWREHAARTWRLVPGVW